MRWRRQHATLLPGVLGALVCASGCGPIEYIATVPLEAAATVAGARQEGADRHAIYELTAAEEYLAKARTLAGYARFQSAVFFGRRATEKALAAKRLTRERAAAPGPPEIPPR